MVEDDWAKAGPKAPITAAAVMLTAKLRSLMLCPFSKVMNLPAASAVPPVRLFPTFGWTIALHMSERRPHDMGGEPGGPIDTADHGMKFWEKQANALRSTLTRGKVLRLDELRRAAEDLGERYYELEYFERTTHALREVLLERGFFTEAELAAKMAEVRKRYG